MALSDQQTWHKEKLEANTAIVTFFPLLDLPVFLLFLREPYLSHTMSWRSCLLLSYYAIAMRFFLIILYLYMIIDHLCIVQ